MTSPLKQIESDIVTAMKAKDAFKLSVLRMVKTALKNQEIEQKREINEGDFMQTLSRMTKQRNESLEQYQKAGRDDLADKEAKEIEILKSYLPEQLSDEELTQMIQEACQSVGAEGPKDMGKVMGALKDKTQGRVDGKVLAAKVKEALS